MFVVWFVVIDFVVCVVSVLFEIVDIRYGYIFNLGVVCKCFWFINYVVSIVLGFMLGVIVVERYWKVCCFFGR